METFIWPDRCEILSEDKSVRNMLSRFLFEITLYEDSQIGELDFNVAAGFTNEQLMKTLVIVNKVSMDLMKSFQVNLVWLLFTWWGLF